MVAELFYDASRPPLVVAELSANHNQSLDRALALVDAAADAGADAVKLQTFRPEWITLDADHSEFLIQNESSPWFGRRLFDLYAEAALPLEWHEPLFQRARERGILAFSAPFSLEAVDFLESIDCPAYKIASFECVDIPLIERAAITGKPIVVSTGMASAAEIDEAVCAVRRHQARGPVLLKCTSSYPAPVENSHLVTLEAMRRLWSVPAGLSDHSLSPAPALVATTMGARMIEKHLTLDRADGGPDAAFSLEPTEFAELTRLVREAHAAIGEVRFGGTTDAESHARKRRRSLYVSRDVRAGTPLSADNIRSVRPGHGLATRHYEEVLGRHFRRDLPKGTPLAWFDIE
ncbi:pseudaminic acid synthase [Guyparkeria halophila]|uniref:Pseudaminic acid synthase n=1 Tax=Guyparkeria halophila TaxID=47960 RepID=A0ABZ0YY81_9GAMM|nr:pseudaminic acid synthase [Guyparkeria halophila]WQH17146.1 pseudaminic acid synthase [Guyparkeria halophila]